MEPEEFIFKVSTGRRKSDKEKFYEKVIAHYGKKPQLRQVQEECAELIVAINHYCRALDDRNYKKQSEVMFDLIEEVADVEIMIEQMKCMFTLFTEAVDSVKQKKLERLSKRIDFR